MSIAVRVTKLGRDYGSVVALAEVNLEFASGRVHAVVGENGAGKSTLFALLAGLRAPSVGSIEIAGQRLRGGDTTQAQQAGVGLLRQQGSLLPELTVLENFALAQGGLGRVNWDALANEVSAALVDSVATPQTQVSELGVGVRQQVELARLLLLGQQILLLDEPTANIDLPSAHVLFMSLRKMAAAGKTVVFSSHRIDEVLEHADVVHVLCQGRLLLSDECDNLDREQLLAAMFGDVLSDAPAVTPIKDRQSTETLPALELRALRCAGWLTPINLQVAAGEVVGVISLAGQGQDALLNTLAGLCQPLAGEVLVGGMLRSDRSLHDWGLRCLLARSTEDTGVATMSVAENLVLHEFQQHPYACWFGWRSVWQEIYACGMRFCAATGLANVMGTLPLASLSGGNQRKVALARELVSGGVAVVAHNPEAGLDLQALRELARQFIKAKQHGLAVLVLAEEPAFLDLVADRMLALHDGKLLTLPRDGWYVAGARALAGLEKRQEVATG